MTMLETYNIAFRIVARNAPFKIFIKYDRNIKLVTEKSQSLTELV